MSSGGSGGAGPTSSFPIYWEKQESALCGTHAINNLLQGPYYTEIGMADIAHSIDERERTLMRENGTESNEYLSFLAQDSSNVDESGNFSIEVLKEALQNFGLECINITSPDCKAILAHPLAANGFICNLQSHWLALRKLNGLWFNLNSLQSDNDGWGPTFVGDAYLDTYLHTLRQKKYTVFVVDGAFPQTDTSVDVQQRGRWFDSLEVIDYTKNPAKLKRIRPVQQPTGISSFLQQSDPQLARALAASMQTSESGGSTVWRGGRAPANNAGGNFSGGGGGGDEDEDLRRALMMSMEDVKPSSTPSSNPSFAAAAASNSNVPSSAAPVRTISNAPTVQTATPSPPIPITDLSMGESDEDAEELRRAIALSMQQSNPAAEPDQS